MRGRGTIALIIFIIVCNGVTSEEAENDLRDFLQYQARTGQPKWESDSDSESGQELVTDSLEYKKTAEKVQNETSVDIGRDNNKQAENVEDNDVTTTMTPTLDALKDRDSNEDRDARKNSEMISSLQIRELSTEEYIYLDDIGYSGINCNRMGQLFNYSPERGVCLICVCLPRGNQRLSPVCAACNGCQAGGVLPENEPNPFDLVIGKIPTTILPFDITQQDYDVPRTPIITIQEASCNPLPEGVPFQHPLNPCQTCLCSRSMSIYGNSEVTITCQENNQCVLPTTTIKLPDKIYVSMPQCQQFPANVVFPHPTSLCKQCVCSNRLQEVMCDDVPNCRPEPDITPYSIEEPTALPTPHHPGIDVFPYEQPQPSIEYETAGINIHPIQADVPGFNIQSQQPDIYIQRPEMDIQWPIDNGAEVVQPGLDISSVQGSEDQNNPLPIDMLREIEDLPAENREDNIGTDDKAPDQRLIARSPLPGPRPHKSCMPFMSNKPFQHPWDPCQVCICTESHNVPYNDIEVNCFTKASCCYSEDGVLVAKQNLITNHKTTIGARPTIDVMCEVQVIGQPFSHPFMPCNECLCKLFGNHVAPVCNYISTPECSSVISIGGDTRPNTIGETGLTLIDLQCRFHRLNEVFEYNCLSCNCFTWREYQIRANCVLLPGCGQSTVVPGSLNGQIKQQNVISFGNGGSPDFGIGIKPSKFSLSSDGAFSGNKPSDFGLGKLLSGMKYGDGSDRNDGGFGFEMRNKPLGEGFYGTSSGMTVGQPNPSSDMYSTLPSRDNNDHGLIFGKGGETMRYSLGNKLSSTSYQAGDALLSNNGLAVSHSSVSETSHLPLYTQMPLSSANFNADASKYLFPQDLGKIKHSWQTVPLPANGYSQKVQHPLSYRVKYQGNLIPHYTEQTNSLNDFQNDLETGYRSYDVQYPPIDYKYPPSFMQSQYDPDETKSGRTKNQGHIPLSVLKKDKMGFDERKGLLTKAKRLRQRIKSGNPEDQELSEEVDV